MSIRAIIAGRNGIINKRPKGNFGSLRNLDEFIMYDDIPKSLSMLIQAGRFFLGLVSNERAPSPEETGWYLPNILERMEAAIKYSIYGDVKFEYCFDHHKTKDNHRLPKPDLINTMMDKYGFQPDEVLMLAAKQDEYDAAIAAGITHIIKIGKGKSHWNGPAEFEHKAETLKDAVPYIMENYARLPS